MIVTVYKVIAALALAAILTFVNSFDIEFYGTPVKSINGFVSGNVSTTLPVISYLQCILMCMTDTDCQGVFFHPLDEVCMLTPNKHYHTNGLQSYPGMLYFQTQPSSCSEWLLIGQANTSGNKQIDPDGRKDQFGPRTIWCDFTTEPGKAVTVLHHDHERRTHVQGYEVCGSYKINLTYDIGFDEVKAIVDVSSECKQYIKFECYNADVYDFVDGGPCAFWRNRYLNESSYFTGSVSFPKYCDCSQTDTCSHSSGCNCVFNDDTWKYDDGFVTNKDDLPITGFQAGDTGTKNEHAYHTIGPLMCF